MKKVSIILAVLLVIAIAVSAAGCGKTEGNSLTGTWEYLDTVAIDNGEAEVTLTFTIFPIRLLSLEAKRITILPSVWPVR